jgi:hypothetical protein
MFDKLKSLFVKEVIVDREVIKYRGTVIHCDALQCGENEKGKCSISYLDMEHSFPYTSLNGTKVFDDLPTFKCSEYYKPDIALINDVNKTIITGK